MADPYGDDVLAPAAKMRQIYREVEATPGLSIAHRSSGFRGRIVRTEAGGVVLRGEVGAERSFRLVAGAFAAADGEAITLVAARRAPAPTGPLRTASGSIAVAGITARIAAGSRIFVEGIHDAALVERVWGDDLRIEGIVVERLDGADDLADVVAEFRPGPRRRLGVLLDHLVDGTKEARIAASVAGPHVLVTGTPYIDVWAAVKPKAVGIAAWPDVPRGQVWKEGVCRALGWQADTAAAWRRILGSVNSWADLEPSLVGAVEQLIDFVAAPGLDG